MKTLLEHLQERFPEHEIYPSFNESGYHDVALIIDDYWTPIWTDDYTLRQREYSIDFQVDLDWLISEVEKYLSSERYRKINNL